MNTYFIQTSNWLWLPGEPDPISNPTLQQREQSAVGLPITLGSARFAQYVDWLNQQPGVGPFIARLVDPEVRANGWFEATFQQPLAGEGADGSIGIDPFCQNVIYNQLFAQIASPFLALVTNNRAHHFSLALAHRAFSTSPQRHQNPHRLVINFDQHEDYGSAGKGIIRCSNWGPYLFDQTAASLQRVNNHSETATTLRNNRVADTYAVVGLVKGYGASGTQPDTSANCKLKMRGSVKVDRPTIQDKTPIDLNGAMAAILNQVAVHNYTDVYITLDRDVMKWSCTGWDDGAYQPNIIRQAVITCIQQIAQRQGMALVGMDITGVPCSDYHTDMTRFAQPGQVKQDAQLICVDDIRQIQAALQAAFPPSSFTIRVTSPYKDDSLSLVYRIRTLDHARSTQGVLDGQGQAVIQGFDICNAEISFPDHGANWTKVATLRTNTSYAIGSGSRYSYTFRH